MFKSRSYEKELLDEPEIRPDALFQNLRELEFINSYLGGHRISILGLKRLLSEFNSLSNRTIVDIGCGGGDSLKALSNWAKSKQQHPLFIGIDLKEDCIQFAKHNCEAFPDIHFLCDDFRNVFENRNVDIVHASLFCHHFTEEEIVSFLRLCNHHKVTFVINDLERNPMAYFSIKWLTRLFSKSPLVKNDAPVSVKRGFKKTEWKAILESAGIKKYLVQNYWAFRHLIIAYPND